MSYKKSKKMTTNAEGQSVSPNDAKPVLGEVTFEGGTVYYTHHAPSGEDWVLLGIDVKGNKVCAAGYPPSIAKLSDCCRFEKRGPITLEERQYRVKVFGGGWL